MLPHLPASDILGRSANVYRRVLPGNRPAYKGGGGVLVKAAPILYPRYADLLTVLGIDGHLVRWAGF